MSLPPDTEYVIACVVERIGTNLVVRGQGYYLKSGAPLDASLIEVVRITSSEQLKTLSFGGINQALHVLSAPSAENQVAAQDLLEKNAGLTQDEATTIISRVVESIR